MEAECRLDGKVSPMQFERLSAVYTDFSVSISRL